MKTSTIIIYAVVLWTLVETRNAGRPGRSLDVEGKGSNLTQKQQQEVIHADILQHFTSTPTPPSETPHDSTSSIKDVPFIPEEINVQSLKNDDNLHVSYDRKITIDKDNPAEDSSDVRNNTEKSNTNYVISYKYNQTGPSSSTRLSHSSYEHSSTSVVYDEDGIVYDENEEVHTQEYPPVVSSTDNLKTDSEWKNFEVKKKEKGKKEILDSVTVPTDYSGTGRVEKPHKDNPISGKLKEKNKDSISEALDERRSTMIRINNSISISVSEHDNNKPLVSLDNLKVALSGTSNEQPVNQSVNSVININGVSSDLLKKPRVKYSVKRANDVANYTDTDKSSAGDNLLSEDPAKYNVPVLNLEPQASLDAATSTNSPEKPSNLKLYPNFQHRHPTEPTPTKLDILGKIGTPSTTTIVKPSIAFKQQLANKLRGLEPSPTAPMNVSEDTTDENVEKSSSKSVKSNLRKKPKLEHYSTSPEMYIPPTATAWSLVSMRSAADSLMTSRKPASSIDVSSSTPVAALTTTTDRQTTVTPFSRVKSFVPWSTRLQKTTTFRPPTTASIEDITSTEHSLSYLDSAASSSSSNDRLEKKSESLKHTVSSSPSSTTEDQSVIRTTLELNQNLTESSVNVIQASLNDVMVKDQSTVAQDYSKTVGEATTERLAVTSSTAKYEETESSLGINEENNVAERENIIETKQTAEENESNNTNNEHTQEEDEEKLILSSTNNTANEVTITDLTENVNEIQPANVNESLNPLKTTTPSPEVVESIKLKKISDSELDPATSDILVDGAGEDGKSGEESEEDFKPKQTTTLPPIFEPFETTVIPDLDEDVEGESEREEEDLSVIIDKLPANQTENLSKVNETVNQVTPTTPSLSEVVDANTTGTYITSFDIVSKENATQMVTKTPSEGDINWYDVDAKPVNASEVELNHNPIIIDVTSTAAIETTIEPETTTETSNQETTVTPETTETVASIAPATTTAPVTEPTVVLEDGVDFEAVEDPTSCIRIVVRVSPLKLCHSQQQLRESIASQLLTDNVSWEQVLIMSRRLQDCERKELSSAAQDLDVDVCFVGKDQEPSPLLRDEFLKLYTKRPNDPSFPIVEVQMIVQPTSMSDGFDNVLAAIILSVIAAICLVLLGILLVIIRKRQGKFNYGQRCTPVSLDDYSLDNISVYNSVRRKGALRASKRSYGNPAFDDPVGPTHPINFAGLANFSSDREALDEEFNQVPMITVKPDELPPGAESKNRYANVIPLPETRVPLTAKDGAGTLDQYINANYIKGSKGQEKLYIACQAPLQSTVEDFWRMVWQQQTKVILMLTALNENGVEKCADYLPQLEITDCHRLFGDFQVTLKKHEVREKYIISNLQLKNLETNLWREVTHLWYSSWPSQGVPEDGSAMIAYLIEARSYMRGAQGPTVVHCSPGTGRTGTVIAIDLCIRDFETLRSVDIPKTVYALRRDRAGSVQTKDQYAFIYQVLNLYATKLTGGALDSI